VATEQLRERCKALLEQIAAAPRFAGSSNERRARDLCRSQLRAAGFSCHERAFEYSRWPAMWGSPLASIAQLLGTLLLAWMATRRGAAAALLTVGAFLPVLWLASRWVRTHGTARLPWLSASATNLEAVRGEPGAWLVAHLDSKSQTIPMLWRIAGTVAASAVSAAAIIVALLQLAGVSSVGRLWASIAAAAVVAALPGMLCFVRNASSGAVDNASGVVAVVLAAEELSRASLPVGVLITSAEELGLAGARAWTSTRSGKPTMMINCDTVDDGGRWYCMYTGDRPAALVAAVNATALRLGVDLTTRPLLPGILADSVAFADAGLESVTISRGNLRTLARIHTRGDNSALMTAAGAADASLFLTALVTEIS